MATTVFIDYSTSTPIVAEWLNHVNRLAYHAVNFDETPGAEYTELVALGSGTGVILGSNRFSVYDPNGNILHMSAPAANVSIGSTTLLYVPAATRRVLHFSSTANVVSTVTAGTGAITEIMHQVVDSAGSYIFTGNSTVVNGYRIRMEQAGLSLGYAAAGGSVTWASGLVLDSSGNIGIGIAPTAVLTIKNPTAAATSVTILPNGSSGQIIFRNVANSLDNLQLVSADTYAIVGPNSGIELRLQTNGTAQMAIHATSGVITTLPTYNNTSGSAANVYVDSSGILYRSTSSLKYKTTVVEYNKGVAEVLTLRPVSYKEKNREDSRVFTGFIAEEVDAAGLGEFVEYAADGTPDALFYANMVALLVNAVKELHTRVETLEGR